MMPFDSSESRHGPDLTLGLDIGGSAVKAALLDPNGVVLARTVSRTYQRPDRSALVGAIRTVASGALSSLPTLPMPPSAVGLCLPGRLAPDRSCVEFSANIPALNNLALSELLTTALPGLPAHARRTPAVCSDAIAAALGAHHLAPLSGRVFCLAMGTGVGAALLHEGTPLTIDGFAIGHFGQLDVSLSDDAPIGPDGGRGSLEAYIGLPALRARAAGEATDGTPRGDTDAAVAHSLGSLTEHDEPLRALARALRIAHALYRPDHIRLLGGVGMLLEPALPALRALVEPDLTRVAKSEWSLTCADDRHLAAIGAALHAVRSLGP